MMRKSTGKLVSAIIFLGLQIGVRAQQPAFPPGSAFQQGPDGKSVMIRCGSPPSIAGFEADLEPVTSTAKPLGAPAELHLPTSERIRSMTPGEACNAFLPEVQIEALRRTKLFDSIEIHRDAAADGRPTGTPAGFMLWIENGQLMAAYGATGPRQRLAALNLNVATWAKGAATTLASVKDYAGWHNDVVLSTYYGRETFYNINGVEYADLGKAKEFLAQRFANPTLPRAAQPLAKRARIILSPDTAVLGPQLHAAAGLALFRHVVSNWRAEVISNSGLFETVSIEESETIPAPAAGEVVFVGARGGPLNCIALAPDKLQPIPEGPQGLAVTTLTGPNNYEVVFMRAPNDAAQWSDQVREAVSKLAL